MKDILADELSQEVHSEGERKPIASSKTLSTYLCGPIEDGVKSSGHVSPTTRYGNIINVGKIRRVSQRL